MVKVSIEDLIESNIVPTKVARLKLSSGYEMPYIGYGTWQTLKQIHIVLPLALEYGYRLIDTEPYYECEEAIGEVLTNWFNQGHTRDEIFIVTRCVITRVEDPEVEATLIKSLEKLGLDYVDMYLLGRPIGVFDEEDKVDAENHPTVLTEIEANKEYLQLWRGMEKQVNEGRAKSIGLSNFTEFEIFPIVANAEIQPSNLQIEFTIYNQQKQLLDFCKLYDIHVTAYAIHGSPRADSCLKSITWKDRTPPLNNPTVQVIAERRKLSAAQVLLIHALQSGVSVLTSGLTRREMRENIWSWYYELGNQEIKELMELDLGDTGKLFHTTRRWPLWTPPQNNIPSRQARVFPFSSCQVL